MSVPNQPPQQGRNTPMAAPPQEFAPYQGGAPQGTNTYPGGVPYQGYPQAYAGGPQVQMPPRVN